MDIFNVLTLVGGLCLFLFGMNLMGQALERRAGGKLRTRTRPERGSVGRARNNSPAVPFCRS